jgi:hypothetical protein
MSNVVKARTLIGRLAIAWATVALFFFFGDRWLANTNLASQSAYSLSGFSQ